MRFASLVLSAAVCFTAVSAAPSQPKSKGCHSNAECLQQGKPVMKPKHLGSPTRRALPQVSSGPPVATSGLIEVTDSTGVNTLGYLSQTLTNDGAFTYSFSAAELVSFSADAIDPTSGLTLTLGTAPSIGYQYLAGSYGTGGTSILGDNGNYVVLTAADDTSTASSTPEGISTAFCGYTTCEAETGIWTFDPSTQELTAQWVNPAGDSLAAEIGFDPASSDLILSESTDAYNTAHGANVETVRFFLGNYA
ncbi:hypothetical protein EHS25_003548 [Saitozyma podzolica]|uniref:Uncharacterized protein n=1 Tax=Saitozyma podzolica TaxID=1890683 RepID=A0A427Y7K2_9TREE|nr:hypothetical protein EHS25_003548 [Saitozyma podzolica]